MKKNILIIILTAVSILSAQSEQKSIDLPDFVITGRQSVQIPIAVKRKPDFVSTISQEYLLPQYSPEELPLLISSEPIPVHPAIISSDERFTSSVIIQAGRYSLPVGEFNFNQSFGNYLLRAKIWGSNIGEYIPNAGYNTSGLSLSNDFFFSTKSNFLAGANLKMYADYCRNSYKLFGTDDPTFLRKTSFGNALFNLFSSYNRWMTYGFVTGGNILTMNDNDLKETNIFMKGLLEFKLNGFSVGGAGYFIKQILNNSLSKNSGETFFSADGYAKLTPMNFIIIKAGASFYQSASDNLFSPFASLELQAADGLTAFFEYKPYAEFLTVNDLLKKNIYYNLGTTDYIFTKYKTNISGILKYEYDKIFSISFSGGYSKANNYIYLSDVVNRGKFDLIILPEVSVLSAGLNLIIHPNGLGYFLSDIKFKDAKTPSESIIPYESKISSILSYGYDFYFGAGIKLNYQLAFNTFTDIANTNKLNDYHNISCSLYYKLLKGLKVTADFQNILNRSNFVWNQYQEKPFDILFGIEYRW